MVRPKKEVIQPEDKYIVRFPDGMRDQLKVAAKENNRSLNAEILARLKNSQSAQLTNDEFADKIADRLLEKLDQRTIPVIKGAV